MENIKESILNTLNERIASPLVGSFVISWAIWNYKTILIILSTRAVEEKILFLETNMYQDWLIVLERAFAYPLLTTIIFLFLFPYPERFVYAYWYGHKEKLRTKKQAIENKKLLTHEESRKLRQKIVEVESDLNQIIDEKDLEIKSLKDIITNNENKIEDVSKATKEQSISDDSILSLQDFLPPKDEKLKYGDLLNPLETIYDKYEHFPLSTATFNKLIRDAVPEKNKMQFEVLMAQLFDTNYIAFQNNHVEVTPQGKEILVKMFGNK